MNPYAHAINPHESSNDYEPAINCIMAEDDKGDDVYEFGCWLSMAASDNVREQIAEIIRLYKNGNVSDAGVARAFLAAYEESRRVRAEQTVIGSAT